MAEIKGKFIMLCGRLMSLYEDKLKKADNVIFAKTGKHWDELDPESWYDAELYRTVIAKYVEGSPGKEKAMVTLGKLIYPTIKETAGFPPELKTPLDYIVFESDGYMANLRGPEIKPRNFLKKEEGEVILETRMEEQPCKLLEGVYIGILEMIGITSGKVEHNKCITKGDLMCEFRITW